MEQETLSKLFKEISEMHVAIAILITKFDMRDQRCTEHQKSIDDHDIRLKVLEKALAIGDGFNKSDDSWKATLYKAATLSIAIVTGAVTAVGIFITAQRLSGG